MAARGLLFCSDQKALEVVQDVLQELHVSTESFTETSPAVARLANAAFDVILVDCDVEKSAEVLFEACRKSSFNAQAMTVAVADGKLGVPNAFRLGANMVLGKPLSREQAKSTIRTALAMYRKGNAEGKASAAAAGAAQSSDAISISKPASLMPASSVASAPMSAGAATEKAKLSTEPAASAPKPAATPAIGRSAASAGPDKPSRLGTTSSVASPSLQVQSKSPFSAAAQEPAEPARKNNPYLLAIATLLLATASVSFAWKAVPGFRETVLDNYNKLQARLFGKVAKPVPQPPAPVKPPTTPTPPAPAPSAATTPAPVPAKPQIPDGFLAPEDAPTLLSTSAESSASAPTIKQAEVVSTAAPDAKPESEVEPVTVPEELADEHVTDRVDAKYPPSARKKKLEGEVILATTVNEDGTVASVKRVSGNWQFVMAASEAVQQWHYQPYYHDGHAVKFQTQVTLQFQLSAKHPK